MTRDALDMDALTTFGLLAVTAMLLFYALEERSPWYVLAFAGACALASVYGFLQGAWPFGIIEAIWAGVAARRWHLKLRAASVVKATSASAIAAPGAGTHAPSPTPVKRSDPASAPAYRP